ncbi:aminoglycoside phosphotransferase [Amycolatopsis sp. WAC 04197]|uniref:phosphotransferase n=1 Tax=Amycolatopsis sp. WAC 04197 TaxID=2203199 RepID=UPI000F7AA7CD|nr:phosphotransferase [Amycolatopsis sp. WAC 04197]RSN38593.1 aminoglycoside phosphotransferase [Amycolatopsis sp. WAC 04197]
MTSSPTQSDETFRAWMLTQLDHASGDFKVTVTGEPRFGWQLRSVSTLVRGADGPLWLRVGCEQRQWADDPMWTGIPESNAITDVPKPIIVNSATWSHGDLAVRADLMTVLDGTPCAPTEVLRQPLDVDDSWFAGLRHALYRVAITPTTRFARPSGIDRRTAQIFGATTAAAMPINHWATMHGDLHWNNVLAPSLGILDWEMWGCGPVGIDAATLYLNSLLVPETARRVHETFVDVLDSPAGRTAQVYGAARIIGRGDHPDLIEQLRPHVRRLLAG